MAVPTAEQVAEYLGDAGYTAEQVGAALAAEKAAQARRCRVPADDALWPEDLAEALCRRVARNLAMRGLPLGLFASASEAAVMTTRVGWDVEISRFEAPYKRLVVG